MMVTVSYNDSCVSCCLAFWRHLVLLINFSSLVLQPSLDYVKLINKQINFLKRQNSDSVACNHKHLIYILFCVLLITAVFSKTHSQYTAPHLHGSSGRVGPKRICTLYRRMVRVFSLYTMLSPLHLSCSL